VDQRRRHLGRTRRMTRGLAIAGAALALFVVQALLILVWLA
jgi:hypothetical protein